VPHLISRLRGDRDRGGVGGGGGGNGSADICDVIDRMVLTTCVVNRPSRPSMCILHPSNDTLSALAPFAT
jgi:hypothetical protein